MKRNVKYFAKLALVAVACAGLSSCGGSKSEVQKIIDEAQTMDRNDLYKKAMEELNGKTMHGVGNSSRGGIALKYFINYLKGLDADGNVSSEIRTAFPYYSESFTGQIDWQQPKNNAIFEQLEADSKTSSPTFSMTLIQDANQIQSKMIDTGVLLNYVPKEWKGSNDNKEPFALQSLNKVFEFNNLGEKTFTNVWDFVREGEAPQFMGINSEPVGKNFLLMLTKKDYADIMKKAYDKLTGAAKTRVDAVVAEVASEIPNLGSVIAKQGENVKYSLAWIKLFLKQASIQTDDAPIAQNLTKKTAVDSSGLLVYSKLRSIGETADVSKKNVTIAAYQDNYAGVGGFMYKHYLQVTNNSPFPWTSCAFINFMTTSYDGFKAWGKDIGGYCSNTTEGINQDHSKDGMDTDGTTVKFASLNDKGYEWWTSKEEGKGRLVIEEPVYTSQVNFKLSQWFEGIK